MVNDSLGVLLVFSPCFFPPLKCQLQSKSHQNTIQSININHEQDPTTNSFSFQLFFCVKSYSKRDFIQFLDHQILIREEENKKEGAVSHSHNTTDVTDRFQYFCLGGIKLIN